MAKEFNHQPGNTMPLKSWVVCTNLALLVLKRRSNATGLSNYPRIFPRSTRKPSSVSAARSVAERNAITLKFTLKTFTALSI